eukprot:jgi/Psemu1/33340/gm1.33340_g
MTSLPISSNNAAAAVAVAAAADTTTMDSSTTSIVLCAKSSSPPICSRPRLVRFAEDESERSAWSSSSQSFCPPKAVVRKHSLSADGREKLMDLLIAASNEFCLDSDNKHEEEEDDDNDDTGSGSGFVSRSVAATGATCGDSNNSNKKKKNNNKKKNNKNTIRISLESSSLSSSSEPNATGNETAPSHQRAAWISASHSLAQCPPQVVRRKTSLNADARSLVKTILAVVSNCESCSDSEDSALEDVGGAEPTEESSVTTTTTTTTTRRRNNENDEGEGDTQRPRVLRFSDEPSERGAWNSSAQSFGPPPFVTRKLSLNKGVQNFVESLVSAIGNDGKSNDNDNDETEDETDAVENTAGGETVTATGKTATTTDAVPIPNRNRRSSIIRNRNRKADESFHRGAWNSSSERLSPPPSIKRREESARHLIMEALVSAMDGGGEDCGTTEGNPKTNTNTKKTKASRRGSIVRFADADDPSERGAMRSSSHSKGPPRCVKRQLSVDAQTLIEAIVSSVVVVEEEEMDDEDFATTDAGEPTAAAGRHPSSSQEPHEADPPTPTPTPPSDSQSSELQPRRFSEPPAGTPSTDSLSVGLPPRRPSTGRSAWLNPEMRTSLRSIRPPGPPKRSDSSSKIDTSDV